MHYDIMALLNVHDLNLFCYRGWQILLITELLVNYLLLVNNSFSNCKTFCNVELEATILIEGGE